MRTVTVLLAALFVLAPATALAEPALSATVRVMDALAALRSCGDDPDCLSGLLPGEIEVDPATGIPLLQVRGKGALDAGPLNDWALTWSGVELQEKLVSSAEASGFEVDLWMDPQDGDAWLDLVTALEVLGLDGEVTLGAVPFREPGVHRDLADAPSWLAGCGGDVGCLQGLRREHPWLDPEKAAVLLEIEIDGAGEDDSRVAELETIGWVEPPSILRVGYSDGGGQLVRVVGRLDVFEVDLLEGRFDLRVRPVTEAELSPVRLGLDVVDAAADVAACGGHASCLFDVARTHQAAVSPQGQLGVTLQGPIADPSALQWPGWFGAQDNGSSGEAAGLIDYPALRALGLGRWLPGVPVEVRLDRKEDLPDEEEKWLASWEEGSVDPEGADHDDDQADQQAPILEVFDDLWPSLDLADAHPGQTTGLTLPWSSLDPYTLDGELVEELLVGAAGDEQVIDGVFTHTIPLPVPAGRGGLAPTVAISFADRADRWLGRHWVLAGLSSVERDPAGAYRVGGARLVEVSEPTPIIGVQGYRTEHDDGGLYFRSGGLWHRIEGGTTIEYGAIEGLCGAVEGPPTRWWICREQDARGNSVLYEYDQADGLVRPRTISWGQSELPAPDPDQPGAARDLALDFDFDVVRPDSRLRFVGSGWAVDDLLLGSVELTGGPGGSGNRLLIRRWELDYDVARPSNTPLLSELRVVGTDGVTSQRLRQLRYHHEWGDAIPIDQVDSPPPSDLGFDDGAAWTDTIDISGQFPGTEDMWARTLRLNHDALVDLVFFDIDQEWTDGQEPVCMVDEPCPDAPSTCFGGARFPQCLEPGDPEWDEVCAAPATVRAFVNVGDLQFVEDPEAAAVIADWMGEQPVPDSTADAYFGQLQFVDLNSDGMDDLVGPETILLSRDTWDWRFFRLPPLLSLPLPTQPNPFGDGVIWADVDGDGRPDAITPPQDSVEEVVAYDGHPGGLCVVPPPSVSEVWGNGNNEAPFFLARMNRTEGQIVAMEEWSPWQLEVPFFDAPGGFFDADAMAQPVMQVADVWSGVGCSVGNVPGTLIPGTVLTILDHDEAALAAALSGWSYLANHVQFVDANTDGCADVAISMETGPLQDIGALPDWFHLGDQYLSLEDWLDVPDHLSSVFYGDCQGGFSPLTEEAHLGWPSSRTRHEFWEHDGHVPCGAAPFNGRALSTICGDPMLQPWVMKECNPSPSDELCCSENGCNLAFEICEDWFCPSLDVGSNGVPMEEPDPDDWVFPIGWTPPSWTDDLGGNAPDPWDPTLGYRLDWSDDAYHRRPGGSLTPTLGGQFSDLDGDGRLEWLQGCTRQGHDDPLSPSFVEGPVPDPAALGPMLARHPLAAWFPADANTFVPIDGQSPRACELAAARSTGVDWLGAMVVDDDQNTPPILNQDVASLLVDLDGDGFVDQLLVDGTGWYGNPRWGVRRQLRSAPELSLQAITYPTGEYPEATAHLSWASLPATENPNLPFIQRDVVEIVDRNGHRVWGRGQCRITDGESVGCGVVVGQGPRGAFHKGLYTTRREVPGWRWLSATYHADGRIENLGVSLISGLEPVAGLDVDAPFDNDGWRECGYRLDGAGFDPSLETYVEACLGWDSPYVTGPGAGLADLWLVQGQIARTWPYADGLLGHAVQLPGLGDLLMNPATTWELFPTTTVFDPVTGRPSLVFDEQHASTPDDDLRRELVWTLPGTGHGPRLDAMTGSNAHTGEVYEDLGWVYEDWERVETARSGAAETITVSALLDDFGRRSVSVSPTGGETTTAWHWCGGPSLVIDPVGRQSETLWSDRCDVAGTSTSLGLSVDRTLDPLGFETITITEPGAGTPPLTSRSAVDRDSIHYGHFGEAHPPQRASSDGRTLSRAWLDVKGRVWKRVSCALASMPSVGAPPSDYACLPSTEAQVLVVHAADGRVVARSRPHRPGSLPVWTLFEHDDLGRTVAFQEVVGSYEAVLDPDPSTIYADLEYGPVTAISHQPDGMTIDHPGGVQERLIHAALEELHLLDGQVVRASDLRADGRELQVTDVAGRTQAFEYDDFGRIGAESLPAFVGVDAAGNLATLTPSVNFLRDEAGRVLSYTDTRGARWTREYDAAGRPLLSEGPPNAGPDRVLIQRAEYIEPSRLVRTWDADGAMVEVETDGLGRTLRASWPDGTEETRSYDAHGGVASAVDRRALASTPVVTWEPTGESLVLITASDGATTASYSSPEGRHLRAVDADGVASDVEYDAWGRPVRWRLGGASPSDITTWPDGQVQLERGYDERGLVAWECPHGVASGQLCRTFEHTPLGQLAARHEGIDPAVVEDPASWSPAASWSWSWRADGLVEAAIDPLGTLSEYIYDAAGRPQEILVDGVSAGQAFHDLRGDAVRLVSPVGDVTDLVLDDWGRLVQRWLPGTSAPETFGYHDDGMLRWFEDGDGRTSGFPEPADRWFVYDEANRAVAATEWNGLTRKRDFDGPDLAAEWSVGPGREALAWSEYEYDPRGRQVLGRTAISLDCAEGAAAAGSVLASPKCGAADAWGETSIAWSLAGRRDRLVDPEGNATDWLHDAATGRLAGVLTKATETRLARDPLGRLEKLTQGPAAAPAAVARLSWDALGRLESETWDAGGDVEELRFTYDVLGRPIHTELRHNGAPVEEEYVDYDSLGRPIQLGQNLFGQPGPISPFNGTCDGGELCLHWRDDGRLESVVYPDSAAVTYEYDAGRLDRVCEGAGCAGPKLYEVQARDAVGRPTLTRREGDVWEETDWSRWGSPERVAVDYVQAGGSHGASTSIETLFGYDATGRQQSRDTVQVGLALLGDSSSYREYGHNAAGWLDREEIDGDVFVIGWDRAGNRISRLDQGEGFVATYGPDNRLDVWTELDGAGGAVSTQLQYDARGNRLDDPSGRSLSYTPRGRLERVVDAGGKLEVEYAYGVRGRRVAERSDTDKRTFQHGLGAFLPWVVGGTAGDSDQVLASGTLLATVSAVGDLSTLTSLGTAEPMLQADKTGALGWQGSWDAWGNPLQADGQPPAAGFGGMLGTIADVPYLAAAARDYDPVTGTWLQPDPLGVDGGLNVYRYAEGDPVDLSDPSGLCVDVTPADEVQRQMRDLFWKTLKAQGVVDKTGRPGRLSMLSPCAASPNPRECGRQQESHEYFEAAAERASQRRRMAQRMAKDLGMTRSEWNSATAGNSLLVEQMAKLADTLDEYATAQSDWINSVGLDTGLSLGSDAGPSGILMDTPAGYLTGRVPSRHFADAFASNGYLGNGGEVITHDGPIYYADFSEAVEITGEAPRAAQEERLPWFVGDSLFDRWRERSVDLGQDAGLAAAFTGELTGNRAEQLLQLASETMVDHAANVFLPGLLRAQAYDMAHVGWRSWQLNEGHAWATAVSTANATLNPMYRAVAATAGYDPARDKHYELGSWGQRSDIFFGVFGTGMTLGVFARAPVSSGWGHVRGSPTTWNEFQTATAGVYSSRAEAGAAWAAYKDAFGLGRAASVAVDGAGQVHHLVTAKIAAALDEHQILAGLFSREDPRLVRRAVDLKSHRGYQRWHRDYDLDTVRWLRRHDDVTPEQFIRHLDAVHSQSDMVARFGNVRLSGQFGIGP